MHFVYGERPTCTVTGDAGFPATRVGHCVDVNLSRFFVVAGDARSVGDRSRFMIGAGGEINVDILACLPKNAIR